MAAAAAANDTTPAKAAGPQLKLLVDKRSRRVLYAEARKDAVDFLIGLLRVPAGLAARVLASHGVAAPGSLATLYAAARALDDAFFLASPPSPGPDRRDAVLAPAVLPSAALPLLGERPPPPPPPPPPKRYYRCNAYAMPCRSNPLNVTDTAGLACPGCRQPMMVEMKWAAGGGSKPAEEEEAAAGGGVAAGAVAVLEAVAELAERRGVAEPRGARAQRDARARVLVRLAPAAAVELHHRQRVQRRRVPAARRAPQQRRPRRPASQAVEPHLHRRRHQPTRSNKKTEQRSRARGAWVTLTMPRK